MERGWISPPGSSLKPRLKVRPPTPLIKLMMENQKAAGVFGSISNLVDRVAGLKARQIAKEIQAKE